MNYHYDDSFHPNLKKQPQVPMLENKNLPKQVHGCFSYEAGREHCNQLFTLITLKHRCMLQLNMYSLGSTTMETIALNGQYALTIQINMDRRVCPLLAQSL